MCLLQAASRRYTSKVILKRIRTYIGSVRLVLGSRGFFFAVLAVLIFQAGWIALSGRFPMAYDEQNHLGIVKLYAEHPAPFWSEPPPGPAPYSSVSRDPSYVYHWLMSLPYHLFDIFLPADDQKILAYRFISIGLFAVGLILYRRVLLKTAASKALVHSVLAVFVLIPTVPYLAGQMNYDNLLFLLVATILLLTMSVIDDLRRGTLRAVKLAMFASLAMLTGLVKFPFLAILLPLTLWIGYIYWRNRRKGHWRNSLQQLRLSFRSAPRLIRIVTVLLLLVSTTLFVERYGVNIVRYGTPTPECDQVLSVERCMAFGPWKRNYDIYQAKLEGRLDPISVNPLLFFWDNWLIVLVWQFFYTLNGPIDGFSVGFPLPGAYYSGVAMASVGALLVLVFRRHVFRRPYMRGLVFVSLFYVFVLWAQNYSDFLRLNLATAIQARYIVLVLPVLLLGLALAYSRALRSLPSVKVALVLAVLAVFVTQGGGIGVYIMRSDPLWWWQSGRVIQVNQAAQRLLAPIVIGEDRKPVPKPPKNPDR